MNDHEPVTVPSKLPIVIIGAGPVGLAAAAHAVRRGLSPIVVEAGSRVGESVRSWGHVRVFSPWKYNVDEAAGALLIERGWAMPDGEAFPTGDEIAGQYLEPLSKVPAIAAGLRLDHRVVAVGRLGADKLASPDRRERPFAVRVNGPKGEERIIASAVIDASGTYQSANPLGSDGWPAIGEADLGHRIFYGIPDVLGRDRDRYADRRVLVVGSGHSAFNALLNLHALRTAAPNTRSAWATRRLTLRDLFGGGGRDQLPERGRLGGELETLVSSGTIAVHTGFHAGEALLHEGEVFLRGGGRQIGGFDEIVVTTGFRPDHSFLRELRLELDPIVESPTQLAPLIDPRLHSCGTVPPHGALELAHPEEPGFYIIGMKSYGRAPTFLMLTGYEQARSVVAMIAGDIAAARDVQLLLPETGVCKVDASAGGCCGPTKASGPSASQPTSASCCG